MKAKCWQREKGRDRNKVVARIITWAVRNKRDIDAEENDVLPSSNSKYSMFPPTRIQKSVTGAYDKMIEDMKNLWTTK